MVTTLAWQGLFDNQNLLLTDFITNLRTRIDEDSEDLLTDIQIKAHIPSAYNEIANKTRVIPDYFQVDNYASDTYFILPDSTNELWTIYMINGNAIIPVPKTSMAGSRFKNGVGYRREGQNLYFYGLTPGCTIKIFASRSPSLPDDNNQYIDIPNNQLECLYLNYELFYWKRRRQDAEIANAYAAYKQAIQDARDNVLDNFGESVSLYGKNT